MTTNNPLKVNIAPTMCFDLSIVPAKQALRDIINMTGNFKDIDYNYATELKANLTEKEFAYKHEIFGYILSPPALIKGNREIIKQVIGKDGCYFKQTTENCGIDFIYYDQEHEMFMFWGPSKITVNNAMKIINSRIGRTIAKQSANNPAQVKKREVVVYNTDEYEETYNDGLACVYPDKNCICISCSPCPVYSGSDYDRLLISIS
jgi:hypothetical protein